jgi:heme-degrading monooxygenase HmoA
VGLPPSKIFAKIATRCPLAAGGARDGGTPACGKLPGMVLEVALLDIVPGREDEFAAAYAKARDTLVGTPGCRSVRMTRGVESPSRFVLLVEWDSVEAHEQNFRATERFTTWRGLIGEYFDGAPRVEHFEDV